MRVKVQKTADTLKVFIFCPLPGATTDSDTKSHKILFSFRYVGESTNGF